MHGWLLRILSGKRRQEIRFWIKTIAEKVLNKLEGMAVEWNFPTSPFAVAITAVWTAACTVASDHSNSSSQTREDQNSENALMLQCLFKGNKFIAFVYGSVQLQFSSIAESFHLKRNSLYFLVLALQQTFSVEVINVSKE